MKRLVLISVAAAALVAAAAPARAGDRIAFRATDSGSFVFAPTSDPAIVATTDVGVGHATHLGRFTLQASENVNLATLGVTGGTYTLTAANGDTVYGTYAGSAAPTADPAVITYVVTGPILGGTGRFAGATGFLTWEGWGNLATGELGDRITGWISNGGSR